MSVQDTLNSQNAININEGYKTLSSAINQTILVAGALITITVTIYEKIVKNQSPFIAWSMRLCWVFLALSIFTGVYCNHFISIYISGRDGDHKYTAGILDLIHFSLFTLGIACLIAFAIASSINKKVSKKIDFPEKVLPHANRYFPLGRNVSRNQKETKDHQ